MFCRSLQLLLVSLNVILLWDLLQREVDLLHLLKVPLRLNDVILLLASWLDNVGDSHSRMLLDVVLLLQFIEFFDERLLLRVLLKQASLKGGIQSDKVLFLLPLHSLERLGQGLPNRALCRVFFVD